MAVFFFCFPHLGMGHPEKTVSPKMSKEIEGAEGCGTGRSWVTLELLPSLLGKLVSGLSFATPMTSHSSLGLT